MKDTNQELRKGFRLENWRTVGRILSETEGSEHYIQPLQSIELIEANGNLQGFALGSIIKYASRFNQTNNSKDLIKIIDYAQILLGHKELSATRQKEEMDDLVSDKE